MPSRSRRKPPPAGVETPGGEGTALHAPRSGRRDPRDAAPPHLALTSTWSIRSKIVAVLLVPLVTLILMWGVAAWVTVPPGLALIDAQSGTQTVGQPAQSLITQLQAERRLAVAYVAGGRTDDAALLAQQASTDSAVAEFRERTDSDAARSALTDAGAERLAEVLFHLDSLRSLRADVGSGALDPAAALRGYTQAIEATLNLSRSLIRTSNEDLLREAQALATLSEARELLSREDAVVTGALAAGAFTAADLSLAVQLVGARRHQFGLAEADLHVTDRVAYQQIAAGDAAGTLGALEDRLIVGGRVGEAPPVEEATWRSAHDGVDGELRALETAGAQRLVERGRPQALFIFGRIVATGLLGLLALVVTALASVRVARSLLRRLAGLRQAALEMAIDRLPRVVERLRHGEQVDVAREAPPLPYGADEIGQVGHAFNALQRTAVASAVAEADLRRGVNDVFLNIARRSQTLLHRQLSILDGMERRAEDAAELEDLFRLDHLATRMRRNAEYLVILAGAAPGRGWRLPVPLVDVLRGAVSEIEDYARVIVRQVPDIAVVGRAVGDVIHLLAELIENATTFSPPTSKVVVGAEPVTNGLAIEVEDRGIGILPPILAELNARLAEPPEFDPAAGAQLGLFVVARLAARHGIQVQLRRSAYGGTTAVALLPESVLTAVTEPAALPAGTTGELLPVSSASPTAPRSSGPTAGFTPVTAPGDPLPSRRDTESIRLRGELNRIEDAETAVIIATTGKPVVGRHARPEVIEPAGDPDGLPKRVRQRDTPREEVDITTDGGDARSPEQVRAMMSSYQAGTARGRGAAEADGTDDAALAQGGHSGMGEGAGRGGGTGRRRAGGVDDGTAVEAT